MKKTILALALAAGLTSFAGSAKASIIWNWNLTDSSTSSLIGSGQFITGADLGNGSYLLNSISGTYEGVTITGLSTWYASNIFYNFPSPNNVDDGGIAFATSTSFAGVNDTENDMVENIWHSSYLQDTVGLYNNSQYTNAGANFNVSAVPEPSQVAASILLIGGIAGFVIVRRRKAQVA